MLEQTYPVSKKDVIYRRTIYYWMKMFCLQQLLKYCYLYFSFLSFLFHYVNEFFSLHVFKLNYFYLSRAFVRLEIFSSETTMARIIGNKFFHWQPQ